MTFKKHKAIGASPSLKGVRSFVPESALSWDPPPSPQPAKAKAGGCVASPCLLSPTVLISPLLPSPGWLLLPSICTSCSLYLTRCPRAFIEGSVCPPSPLVPRVSLLRTLLEAACHTCMFCVSLSSGPHHSIQHHHSLPSLLTSASLMDFAVLGAEVGNRISHFLSNPRVLDRLWYMVETQ